MLWCGFDGAATDRRDPLRVIGMLIALVPCAAAAAGDSTVAGQKPGDVHAGCRDERQHYGDGCAHRWPLYHAPCSTVQPGPGAAGTLRAHGRDADHERTELAGFESDARLAVAGAL
jgi:hypothetical protein